MSGDWDGEIANELLIGAPIPNTTGTAGAEIGPMLPDLLETVYISSGVLTSIPNFAIIMSPDGTNYYYMIIGKNSVLQSLVFATGWVFNGQIYEFSYQSVDVNSNTTWQFGTEGHQASAGAVRYAFGIQNDNLPPALLGSMSINNVDVTVGGLTADLASLHLLAPTDIDPANGGTLTVASVEQARGPVTHTSNTADSAAIGATPTDVLTIASHTYASGRVFRADFGQYVTGSIAGVALGVSLYENGAAAGHFLTSLGNIFLQSGAVAYDMTRSLYFCNSSGGAVTCTITLAINRGTSGAAGTVKLNGSAGQPSFLVIQDVGAIADYPTAFGTLL